MLKLRFLVAFLVFILFFGCFKVDVNHIQNADGSADVTHKTDMSAVYSLLGSYGSSYGSTSNSAYSEALKTLQDPCANSEFKYEDVTCSFEKNVLSLKKVYKPEEAFYKFEVKDELFVTKYRLTVDEIPAMEDESSSSSDLSSLYGSSYSQYDSMFNRKTGFHKFSNPQSAAFVPIFKLYGMEVKYVIQMPGEITRAEHGVVEGSTVTFDAVEMMGLNKPIIVESQEFSLLFVGVVVIVGLVVIVLVFRTVAQGQKL